jgi:hypothetical protein
VPDDRPPKPPRLGAVTARAAADQLAAQVSSIMDMIAERMALESPHPSTAKRVRGARTVSREFVVGLTALVEWMPVLSQTYDTAAAHEVLESIDTHKQLAERTALLLASMKYTNEARWAKVVNAAGDPPRGSVAPLCVVRQPRRAGRSHRRAMSPMRDAPAPEVKEGLFLPFEVAAKHAGAQSKSAAPTACGSAQNERARRPAAAR